MQGRTHLSALLLAHGADPFKRNQEGQTPLDLATADDVRSLLEDAIMTPPLPSLPSVIAETSYSESVVVVRYDTMFGD